MISEQDSPTVLEALRRENAALRQQNEALQRIASFPEANPNPVMEFDAQGNAVYTNPATARLLASLDINDARVLLPADYAAIIQDAHACQAGSYYREVSLNGYIYAEIIVYSQEHDSTRIYTTDITEKVKMDQALRESDDRFRLLLKKAPVSVAAQDRELRFVWAYNQRTIDPSYVIGKTDADLFPSDSARWLVKLKRTVLETGKELRAEGWITSNGQRVYLELYLEPIRNAAGEISGVGIATVDITQVKLIQQALEESEARYQALFDGMSEGFIIFEAVFDREGNQPVNLLYIDANPAFEPFTGLKPQDVIGKTIKDVMQDEAIEWIEAFLPVLLTGKPVRLQKYSQVLGRYYDVYAYSYGQANQFAVVFTDITRHVQLENDLRINLTKYSVLFENLPIGVTVSDEAGQILEANQRAGELLGLTAEAQKARRIDGREWRIVRTDGTPMPAEEYASVRALKTDQLVSDVEMGIVKGDDQVTWINVTAAPLPLDGYGVVIAYNDISKRVYVEEALKKAADALEDTVRQRTRELENTNAGLRAEIAERHRVESQLRLQTRALESAADAILITNPEGYIQWANPAFTQMTGYTLQEIIGHNPRIFKSGQQGEAFYQDLWGKIQSGVVWHGNLVNRRKDGNFYHEEQIITPVMNEHGEVTNFVSTKRDLTGHDGLEAQLIEAEKHAAIGRMVGSVTHEINNPLQTIKNCLYLLKLDTSLSTPSQEPLRMAISETQRLANLVAQLRQLYRPKTTPVLHPCELMELIEEVHGLVAHQLELHHVTWQTCPNLQPRSIPCVREQLIEVFLNISINAIEAMGAEGGTLSIDMDVFTQMDKVGVIFDDTGSGIDPNIISHIFEPFTTTKQNGLGLGLAISYAIVQRHGGEITVDSRPGKGTKFTVWLPLSTQDSGKELTT